MNKDNLLIKITRKKASYDYKFKKNKNDYSNNVKNNSLDKLEIYRDTTCIFMVTNVQTVSNHPDFDHKDTIKPGYFKMECFVDPRKFHGEIHGIIDAIDIENQKIDKYSMQLEDGYQKGRWLVHDRYSFAKERDLYNGYSAGCFIMDSKRLKRFNRNLKSLGIKPSDILRCLLLEE